MTLLSGDLSALGDLISGKQGQRASAALTAALDISEQMRSRSQASNQLLSAMSSQAKELRHILSRFGGTVATFHSLGLLTRIETARLGSAGADFGSLAEDVRLLAKNVQQRVDSALDTAVELIPRIEGAVREASRLHEGLANSLPSVIAQVMESLSSFREMQATASQASNRLSVEYAEISDAFKRLMVSMQFNDITRQQVEHVMEVLERLCSESPEHARLLIESPGSSEVIKLQQAQLTNAEVQFRSSVGSVLHSLDEIAGHVAQIGEESQALAGPSRNDRNSFFRQMESGCSIILDTLSRCVDAEAATVSTGEELAHTLGRLRSSITEIRLIGNQMLRIGMNARISAAHLGEEGEALSALADSIKQRSFESKESSDLLIQALDKMSELAITSSSTHDLRAEQENQARGEALREMRLALANLQSSHESSARQISLVLSRGDRLRQDLRTAHDSFRVIDTFAAVIDQTQRKLTPVLEQLQRIAPDDNNPDSMLNLAEFTAHYTMNSEREIHSGVSAPTEAVEDAIEFF